MISRLADKLFFATLLLFALQIPILADHYRQFISGQIDVLQSQAEEYHLLAVRHGYASTEAMLDALAQNDSTIVREDVSNKRQALQALEIAESGLTVLAEGHYFEKAIYMGNPQQFPTLKKVLGNFSPAIPINPQDIVFSVFLALTINLTVLFPHWIFQKRRRRNSRHNEVV